MAKPFKYLFVNLYLCIGKVKKKKVRTHKIQWKTYLLSNYLYKIAEKMRRVQKKMEMFKYHSWISAMEERHSWLMKKQLLSFLN